MRVQPRRAYKFFLFALIPLVVLLLVRLDLNQAGGLDAFFYTALSNDYADVTARYPGYYYATRLAHILPNALAMAVFDDYTAYIGIRYLQLVAATIATFAIARHYADEVVAWFITIFFCSHIWLLRSLLWDYVDGSVVTYTLVGIALLLPRKSELLTQFGAGIAFAWAANGNPMGLVVPAGYAVTWLIERLDHSIQSILKSVLAAAAGFIVGYGLLILAMLAINPGAGWHFELVTYGAVTSLLSGGAKTWFTDIHSILFKNLFFQPLAILLFLAVACVGVICANSKEGRWKAFGALAFMTSTFLIFLVFHFVFITGALGYSFSLIYTLPASIVALSSLVGQWRPRSAGSVLVVGGLFFPVQFAFWSNASDLVPTVYPHYLEVLVLVTAMALCGLALLAASAGIRHRPRLFAAVIVVVLLASNSYFLQKETAWIYGDTSQRQTEWDVRDGALYLQRFISKHVPRKDPVRFWYGTSDRYLNSVQSTHYWLTSRLSAPTDAQMPQIDDAVRKRIREEARYIAILGDEGQVAAALDALKEEGYTLGAVTRGQFKGQIWPGFVVVLGVLK